MPHHILIIGDDQYTHTLLGQIMAGNGFWLSTMSDCRSETFAHCWADSDLIIFDNLSPGTHGWNALHLIRQKSSIPIIALLDTPDCDVRVACLDQGADCCLAKPVDQAELHARIRALLRRGLNGASTAARFTDRPLLYEEILR